MIFVGGCLVVVAMVTLSLKKSIGPYGLVFLLRYHVSGVILDRVLARLL